MLLIFLFPIRTLPMPIVQSLFTPQCLGMPSAPLNCYHCDLQAPTREGSRENFKIREWPTKEGPSFSALCHFGALLLAQTLYHHSFFHAQDNMVLRHPFFCLREGKAVPGVERMMQEGQEVANVSHLLATSKPGRRAGFNSPPHRGSQGYNYTHAGTERRKL